MQDSTLRTSATLKRRLCAGLPLTAAHLERLQSRGEADALNASDATLAADLGAADAAPSAELFSRLQAAWNTSRHQVTVLMAQVCSSPQWHGVA